jgi:hypothetical protein
VKNTDSAEQNRYGAGKKVSGIKRRIGVDTRRLPVKGGVKGNHWGGVKGSQ